MMTYVPAHGTFVDNGRAPVRIGPYNRVRESLLLTHLARYAQSFNQAAHTHTSDGGDNH